MSILSQIQTGRIARAQKLVIYAPEGYGKSTLAAQFPGVLFLDIEDSTAQMEVRRLGREVLPDLKAVEKAIHAIKTEKPCETLVIDTIDWLEQLALEAIIAEADSDKIHGVEDFGYGKGYVFLKERITVILSQLDGVLRAGINVVMLAHCKVIKFEPPDGAGAYDRYELKMSKQVGPLIKEWADAILFGNWRTQIVEKGKGEQTKYKGVGGRERIMHCNRCSAWDAKNRHGLADVEKWEIETIHKAFANVGVPWGGTISEARPAAPATTGGGVPTSAVAPAPTKPVTKKTTAVPPAPKAQEKAATPKPAPQAQTTDGIPGLAPENGGPAPIPAQSGTEPSDPDLEKVVGTNEEQVNAYLVSQKRIQAGQTFRSVAPDYRNRILKNPGGFFSVVANWRGNAA